MANNLINFNNLIKEADSILTNHINNLSKGATAMNSFVNSAKLPSEYVNTLKGLQDANEKIAKSTAEVTKTEKQLQRQRLSDLKLQAKREKAFDNYEKQLKREQTALQRTTGMYNRVQQRVKALTLEYNQLATKKALGMKLDRAELSSLKQITTQLTKYDAVLKKVDADVGKHQRNVGNYKSAYDGLGWSITQIAREAPAFANSLQTGFMAISNNLPMLFDEIAKTKREVASLRAEGVKTSGTLGRLAKSLFSFQTLLSVGVTLLTIYGKDIVEWAQDLLGGDKALNSLAENTKKLNEESTKIASQSIPQFQALVNIVTDLTESEERRSDAIRELSEQYPDFNAEILKERDNTELVNDAVSEYINKIGQKAKAQASMTMMQEKYNELILAEQNTEKAREGILAIAKAQNENIKTTEQAVAWYKKLDYEIENSGASERNKAVNTYGSALDSLNKKEQKEAEIQEEINALMDVYIDNVDLSTTKQKEYNKLKEDSNKVDKETLATHESSVKAIQDQISALTDMQKRVELNSSTYNVLGFQIKTLQTILDGLTNQIKEAKEENDELNNSLDSSIDKWKKYVAEVKKLQEQLENELQNFREGFIDESFGDFAYFGNLIKNLDEITLMIEEGGNKWEDYFLLISESAQQAFNILTKFSDANFENEYNNLEKKYETAVLFAGESATAQEEIDRQYEAKRAKIQKRQAKAQKEQAIFNTIINTAQGIVSTIGQVGFPAAIPLIVAIGAIGATQLALINSQQIPEYAEGTDNHIGGLAKINDAKGSKYRETVRTPDGKIFRPKGRNVIMDLPKGSEVIKAGHEDSFMQNLYKELSLNDIMPFSNSMGSIVMPRIENNGITKDELKEVFSNEVNRLNNTIKNKSETHLSFDENGMHAFSYKNGQKREILNARVRGKSRRV